MYISWRVVKLWIILFVPVLVIQIIINYFSLQTKEKQRPINNYIGSQFAFREFLDTNGKVIDLRFDESEVTIIDFWHKACPPCITEMKEFKELIRGREKKISVTSVSINSFKEWRKVFNQDNSMFAFLGDTISNWRHVVLKSSIDPKLNNVIPSDNIKRLAAVYQTNTFPTYLVLDNRGYIIATPPSAVDYIKTSVLGKNRFYSFLTNKLTWGGAHIWIPKLLIEYSGCFWIAIILFYSIKRKRSSSTTL